MGSGGGKAKQRGHSICEQRMRKGGKRSPVLAGLVAPGRCVVPVVTVPVGSPTHFLGAANMPQRVIASNYSQLGQNLYW